MKRTDRILGKDPKFVTKLIEAVADIALYVDRRGVIRAVYFGAPFAGEDAAAWTNQPWTATVTSETESKVTEMLAEVAEEGVSRSRHINHKLPSGTEAPVGYRALRVGEGPDLVAVGRELGSLAALQERLLEAQQALERDYWRMRQIEARYRQLFQVSGEPVLVVDVETRRVEDANPAAGNVFGVPFRDLIGRTFPFDMERESAVRLERHLAAVEIQGRADAVTVRIRNGIPQQWQIEAFLVRDEAAQVFLVRLHGTGGKPPLGPTDLEHDMAAIVFELPDAFAVIDQEGKILDVNRAFLDLTQLASVEQARGRSIERWVGRPGADLSVLSAMLRSHGTVRLFGTSVRAEFGATTEVEISAAPVAFEGARATAMILRDVGRRLVRGPEGARDLTRAVEQLTELVGRVTLRDLVGDTTALVERHFIEAALELTGDNRTAAAEMLGLSRQSLYSKLRRYNITPPEADETA